MGWEKASRTKSFDCDKKKKGSDTDKGDFVRLDRIYRAATALHREKTKQTKAAPAPAAAVAAANPPAEREATNGVGGACCSSPTLSDTQNHRVSPQPLQRVDSSGWQLLPEPIANVMIRKTTLCMYNNPNSQPPHTPLGTLLSSA